MTVSSAYLFGDRITAGDEPIGVLFENGAWDANEVYSGFDFSNRVTIVGPTVQQYDPQYDYGLAYEYFRMIDGLNPPGVYEHFNTGQCIQFLGYSTNNPFTIENGNLVQHTSGRMEDMNDHQVGVLIPINVPNRANVLRCTFQFNNFFDTILQTKVWGVAQLFAPVVNGNGLRSVCVVPYGSVRQNTEYTRYISFTFPDDAPDRFAYLFIPSQDAQDTIIKKIWFGEA